LRAYKNVCTSIEKDYELKWEMYFNVSLNCERNKNKEKVHTFVYNFGFLSIDHESYN
jgi:hypothetical protein